MQIAALKGVLKFRITASIIGDERLNCVVADGPVGSTAPVVEHIITLPRQFKYRKVSGQSIFANAGDTSATPSSTMFFSQMLKATNISGQYADVGTAGYPLGPYLSDVPLNPFKNSRLIKMIANNEEFPAEAPRIFGWIYKPATKEIRLDWPGTNKDGVRYYDY